MARKETAGKVAEPAMILDDGICTIFRKVDVAKPGDMPKYEFQVLGRHWYKELEFANVQSFPTEGREETQTDARIRVLQDRRVANHDVVVLANTTHLDDVIKAYEITRAYHGTDDESSERITDLTLRRVRP